MVPGSLSDRSRADRRDLARWRGRAGTATSQVDTWRSSITCLRRSSAAATGSDTRARNPADRSRRPRVSLMTSSHRGGRQRDGDQGSRRYAIRRLMYRLFNRFWFGNRALDLVLSRTRYVPMRVAAPPSDIGLPDRYIAAKFYTGAALPDTPESRQALRSWYGPRRRHRRSSCWTPAWRPTNTRTICFATSRT